jgi:hypothetical protein
MTNILAFLTVIFIWFIVGICITKIFIVTHDDYDEEQDDFAISGREESQTPICEPSHQPYTYYLGTNKNKTYKKQKRTKWQEEFDFN